jgi:hypothetical protein
VIEEELRALQLLQRHPNVVCLLAFGQFGKAAAAAALVGTAAHDAVQQPVYCIVEELAECTVLDSLLARSNA